MSMLEEKKYVFSVHPNATKTQIKEAIEKLFEGTEVARVSTMNYKGKKKRRRFIVGTTPKRKKAIIQLTDESTEIEVFSGM
jgi:large subunit ribosomal protein L23